MVQYRRKYANLLEFESCGLMEEIFSAVVLRAGSRMKLAKTIAIFCVIWASELVFGNPDEDFDENDYYTWTNSSKSFEVYTQCYYEFFFRS